MCARATRAGAAARESLQRDRPGGLTSPALPAAAHQSLLRALFLQKLNLSFHLLQFREGLKCITFACVTIVTASCCKAPGVLVSITRLCCVGQEPLATCLETAKWWRRNAGPGYMLYTHRSADLVKNTTFFGYHDALSGALFSTRYIRCGEMKLLAVR